MNRVFGQCPKLETAMALIDYGKHCGPLKGGKNAGDPIDDIDKCCVGHDSCWTVVDR